MSISAGAMESVNGFLRKLTPSVKAIWLTPVAFGLSGGLVWDKGIWSHVRWALSVQLGIREEQIDDPPLAGLPVLGGHWLLKVSELNGWPCLKLENQLGPGSDGMP